MQKTLKKLFYMQVYYELFIKNITPKTPLIHASFTYSKWNMGAICRLKFHSSHNEQCTCNTFFFWNSSLCKRGYFHYWICSFGKNPPFYEVKNIFCKRLCAWRDFKNVFPWPLFTIIFRPKILISGTYSILST